MTAPKKSLGQHWLRDRLILSYIADSADLEKNGTVLEIGPGQGALTSELLRRCKKVVAVEFDEQLAAKLPGQFPGKNLEVIREDILNFDLSLLPDGYKVVANIPYYITGKIVQLLTTAKNKPSIAVLLVQREVAERLAASPGDMSLLAVSAQAFAEVTLGDVVSAHFFTPPPKVDSRVVILKARSRPVFASYVSEKVFFKTVRAGFSAKRKKLRSSLAGGLAVSKEEAVQYLQKANIDPELRAEDIAMDQWVTLAKVIS